jgi:hypothetical protein
MIDATPHPAVKEISRVVRFLRPDCCSSTVPAVGLRPPGAAIISGPARVLCNGKTLAFQAKDTGSIPVTRSIQLQRLPDPAHAARQMSAIQTSLFIVCSQWVDVFR